MAAVRWFRVPISVGEWQRSIYLHQTDSNLFDLQYHWMYTPCMSGNVDAVLRHFREEFTRHHRLADRSLQLTIGEPVEVPWSEVQAARPSDMPTGYFDPP
jgi:hypothetical protein